MKKYLVLILVSAQLFSQDKSKVIYKNETVFISDKNNKLEIETLFSEKRSIAKSKNVNEYSFQIPYDTFNEISNIKGTTTTLKNNKNFILYSSSISVHQAQNENIFKDDVKFKYFVMPSVEDNSTIEYSFKNKILEPRFLSPFKFQNVLKTDITKFQIKCNPSIEIGYKLFGNFQDKIIFTKTNDGENDVYTWEAKEIPEFEQEEDMPNALYVVPHIIYYIKKYDSNGKKEELLNSKESLYKWYSKLVKDINKTDQNGLKTKTLEIIKDKKTEFEKAKAIFEWVQQNLHYVAFENGMGGFIPREAADIHSKLYGDCKDMANLLNEMMHIANIKSSLTWIGTRDKPYKYDEVPTPQVDNHMITNVSIDGKSYFLDATDKFCPFTYPTSMIQGKEALIGKSESEFAIEQIPVLSPEKNKRDLNFNLKIVENALQGDVSILISGFNKSDFLNTLSTYSNKEEEIWKSTVNYSNPKIMLETVETIKNDYKELPTKATYKLKFEDAIKKVNGKIILKPILVFPLKELSVDFEKRKYAIEKNYAYQIDVNYNYEIPADLKIEFLPQNFKLDNEFGTVEINYLVKDKNINVTQKIISKKLLLNTTEFEKWNDFIKTINKQYNQSILLTL